VLSVATGAYNSAQTIGISDATTGATIYYTLDGTNPTTASTVYSGAISVSSTTTVNAIAAAPNYATSSMASATYTISLPAAATPTFSVAAGTYASAQTVTISDATPNAAIYYTTNSAAPLTSTRRYTGPVTISATATLRAFAISSTTSMSAVASATYTVNQSEAKSAF
jgi:hypothetical protein